MASSSVVVQLEMGGESGAGSHIPVSVNETGGPSGANVEPGTNCVFPELFVSQEEIPKLITAVSLQI